MKIRSSRKSFNRILHKIQSEQLENTQRSKKTLKFREDPSNESPNFEFFTDHSSIHGFRFLSKSKNHFFTRTFWILTLIFSLIGLYYNGKRLYVKLNIAPDISITIKQKLAKEVPFPAITLCLPMFSKSGYGNFTNYSNNYFKNPHNTVSNLTEKEKKFLAVNSLKCGLDRAKGVNHCCSNTKIPNLEILKLMDESTPTISEVMGFCNIEGAYRNCEDMFTTVFTESGLCFTTNMLNLDTIYETKVLSNDLRDFVVKSSRKQNKKINWTTDGGYSNNSDTNIFPMRLSKANDHIVVVYSSPEDTFNACRQNSIFIYIHLPNEVPTMFHRHMRLQYAHTKRLQLYTRVVTAHPSLESYTPEARRCFFQHERKLYFYKIYTKFHCYMECLAEFVFEKCKCVGFFMPRNLSVPICGMKERACLEENINKWPDSSDLADNTTPCGCFPTCNHIEYIVDEDNYAYNPKINAEKIKKYNQSNIYSRVIVQFNEHAIQQNEKYVSYKLQNFIADTGGLLGLFLGCSLLSMIEIVYFLFMWLKSKYYKRRSIGISQEDSANQKLFKSLNKISDGVYTVRSPLYTREKF